MFFLKFISNTKINFELYVFNFGFNNMALRMLLIGRREFAKLTENKNML